MLNSVLLFTVLWMKSTFAATIAQWECYKCHNVWWFKPCNELRLSVKCTAISDIYYPHNVSRTKSTLSGIAEYRSALTLDWLAAEDLRQRELALAFETEASAPVQVLASDCISYSKPATGKVARLMLELLKNLEGDNGYLIPELTQALIRSKLLVETSLLEAEPDLESLVKTPEVMMGEPHATFPRILSMTWMAATDPATVKKSGWCPINKVAKYLVATRPVRIAKHVRNLDLVIARARYIMEEFIQHVTPNMYDKKNLDLVRTTKRDISIPNRAKYFRTKPSHTIPHSANIELMKSSLPYEAEMIVSEVTSLMENPSVVSEPVLITKADGTNVKLKSAAGIPKISVLLFACYCSVLALFLIFGIVL